MFDHFFNQRIKVDGDLGNKPLVLWCMFGAISEGRDRFFINTMYKGKGGCIYNVVDTYTNRGRAIF